MEQTINKNFNSLDTLVSLFGINYSNLAKLIYPTTNNLYHSFSIPKKSGELREINAPNRILKEIQYKLLNELQSYYSKRNCTHGFINERNVVTNARPHVKKNIILNLDLKEFFQSIHFGRVRNLFMSNPFNFNKNVATVLAQICCHKGHLPQGAPTSPLITNLICYKLDKELSKLAFNNNCTVTRYVDDITFSFNCSHDKIPRDILDGISGESISISKKLVNIINKNGFEINYKKVRLSSSNQRQQVTGIVTNVKVNLPRKYIKKTQSMLYAWKNFSLPNAEQAHINNYLEKPYKYQRFIRYNKDKSYFNLMIKGRINYIGMVRGQSDCIYRKLLYQYTELIGNPNKELLKSVDDCLADSVFITEYPIESKQGTAFFLKDIGLVTAAHVVEGIHETNSCFLDFFRHYEVKIKRKATLFKKSEEKDIAIFYVGDDFKNLPSLKVGDDSKLAIGDQIKLIGFPDYNYHDSYLSNLGKIIQKKTMYNLDVWIVDLPINFGVSGGPVFNNKNEVIGVALQGSKKHDQSTYSHYFVPISKVIEMAQN